MHDERIPPDFRTALLSLRDTVRTPGLLVEEISSPRGLAPFSATLAIHTQAHEHNTPLATGRLVILHNPSGVPEWGGSFRLAAHMRARIEPEMSSDPLLSEALWHWAHDCLEESGAGYHSLTGTVTREVSESFGGLRLTDSTEYVELRASWTPVTPYLGEHLHAWTTLLGRTAGVLPVFV